MNPSLANPNGIFENTDGGRLNYSVAGHGDPIVFLHGFGLDISMWDAQWPTFSSRFRALRYDLRGFGASSLPTAPYSHVADFIALTEHLKMRPAHLVGLSNGGRIALRIAIEQPSAVRTLTLADTALDGYRWGEAYAQSWREMNRIGRTDIAAAKKRWFEHDLFRSVRGRPEAEALAAMLERYSGWHFQNSDPELRPQKASIDGLAKITTPTLVMVGEWDLPDFHSVARLVADRVPGASLKVIHGAGHVSNLENAAEFNQYLLAHLGQ